MNITNVRRLWATANGEDPEDPELVEFLPDDLLEALAECDEDVVAASARSAQTRDDRQKLRPSAWTETALRMQDKVERYGRCQHGLIPGECGPCPDPSIRPAVEQRDVPLKADLVRRLASMLDMPDPGIGVGSSIPSELFAVMARRVGVPFGSMPEVGEAVARKAGVAWDKDCDSRSSTSGGGSTVTAVGLGRLVTALQRLP
jgi:hypothetical protein